MYSLRRRAGWSVVTAGLLSIVLAGQAVAATWSGAMPLTNSGAASSRTGGLVTLGKATAVAAYANNGRIVVRRSTNSGASWSSPLRLSTNGRLPAIAGRGTSVDVVWVQNNLVRYARSTNTGQSFSASVALSPSGRLVDEPSVGRGANGLVIVAWMEVTKAPCCDGPWNLIARVSTNGGSSFGPATQVGVGYEPEVAAANGVAYVAYEGIMGSDVNLVVRRTIDGGASWSAERNLGCSRCLPDTTINIRERQLRVTAAGKIAFITYTVSRELGDPNDPTFENWVGYRRTANKGQTWSAPRQITTPSASGGSYPVLSLNAGIARVAYMRFNDGIYYRQSSDGLNWSAEEKVTGPLEEYPVGIGFANKIVLMYTREEPSNVFIRLGTP
jgi:hypothetical protein